MGVGSDETEETSELGPVENDGAGDGGTGVSADTVMKDWNLSDNDSTLE